MTNKLINDDDYTVLFSNNLFVENKNVSYYKDFIKNTNIVFLHPLIDTDEKISKFNIECNNGLAKSTINGAQVDINSENLNLYNNNNQMLLVKNINQKEMGDIINVFEKIMNIQGNDNDVLYTLSTVGGKYPRNKSNKKRRNKNKSSKKH